MRSVLLILVILLATSGVNAQYVPFRLPDHVPVQINGERHAAFNLGGFQELLRMDEDLRHLSAVVPGLERQLELYEEEVEALLQVADLRLQDISLLTDERDRLRALWQEENRRRLEAENAPNISSWLGWALAAALGVATVVLVILLAVGG